jgi:DsbC/DsbD-like thiol-disulfide interchange protein/cytochrome c biogenesis protein CcdA/thiol-disulfide isomerase/thioredoxin
MRFLAWLLMLAALLMSGSWARAQMPGMEIHVHAALEAETSEPAPGGDVTLAFAMRPDPGWHGYWQNPGDAGEGLTLEWKLPPGVTASTPRFPVPDILIISGFMNYIYEEPHAILVDLKLSPDIAPGTKLPVSVNAYWLACTDRVCVPQQGRLELELVAGNGEIVTASRTRFDRWRAALPVPLDRAARYAVNGKRIEIAIPFPAKADLVDPYFFPVTLSLFHYAAPQKVRRAGDWLVIETQLAPTFNGKAPETIEGLLRIGKGQGLLMKAKAGEIPAGGVAVPSGANSPRTPEMPSLLWLLVGALVGGVLLNIMPCVFPILGLKALALASAGGDEQSARKDALAYTAGVVLSCLALGGLLLLLRAGGEEIGWAFQLQEPGFVLFLLLLMVGITANLAGLFELQGVDVGNALTRKSGLTGSFWTGALAAAVATPCTGPFMAAALGAALLLPPTKALALFAALGIGIALPFLLIAYVPALRQSLPKPGPWLATFRKAMSVPMGLTALALLWLLWRQSGPYGLAISTVGAILILLALIWHRRHLTGWITLALGAIILAGAVSILPRAIARNESAEKNALAALPFSEARLASLRQQGKSVFVYFTADWCVTCKITEAAVLEREATAKLFKAKDIAVLRGDFTRRDPAIARFLASHGQAGVPLYLYYPKGREAKLLPQILTSSALQEAIAR